MEFNIFYALAIIGLASIIAGTLIINKKTKQGYYAFVLGGICLLAYSIYKQDYIFIAIQSIFILSSLYKSIKKEKKK